MPKRMHRPPSISLASPKVGRMDMSLLLNSEKVLQSPKDVQRREREEDEGEDGEHGEKEEEKAVTRKNQFLCSFCVSA